MGRSRTRVAARRAAVTLAVVLACASSSAAAQDEIDATDIWDTFIAECSEALANPLMGSLDALTGEPGTTLSEDAKLLFSNRPLEVLEAPPVDYAYLSLSTEKWATVTFSSCTVILHLYDDGVRLGLHDLGRDRASEVLGSDLISIGGAMVDILQQQSDRPHQYNVVFASGPFPADLSLRVVEMERYANLQLFQISSVGGN